MLAPSADVKDGAAADVVTVQRASQRPIGDRYSDNRAPL
jgi:hypothetical protein